MNDKYKPTDVHSYIFQDKMVTVIERDGLSVSLVCDIPVVHDCVLIKNQELDVENEQ